MKRIMILGGGIQQLPAIRQAWSMGWYSIVVDGNPRALGRREASAFYNVDIKDTAALIELATSIHNEHAIDAVFTTGTDFSVSVAMLAEALSLPGVPVDVAKTASNKILMRQCLQQGGRVVPDFQALDWKETTQDTSLQLAKEFVATHSLPVVLKPADSMGSRGVRFINQEHELPDAMAIAGKCSQAKELIIEERIVGNELSIDGLVQNGKLFICGIADRNIMLEPYRVEIGHSFPTQVDSNSVDLAIQELQATVEILGVENGAFKGDVFVDGNTAVIGEVALRLSGGFMSGWTIPYFSGVDAVGHAMRIAANLPLDITTLLPHKSCYINEHAIISIPGSFVNIHGSKKAWEEKGLRNMFLYPSPGDRVRVPQNNVEKIGSIIVSGRNEHELAKSTQTILSHITIGLALEDEETERFLFGASPEISIGPVITHGKNRDFLYNLPAYDKRLKSLNSRKPVLPVWNLPFLSEEFEVDWKHQTLAHIINFAKKQGYIRLVSLSKPALGLLFWRAVERGGMQAIDYCVRSLQSSTQRTLARWQNFVQ